MQTITLLLVALVMLSGCGCTDIGCTSALEVTIPKAPREVAAVEVLADAPLPTRCNLDAPTASCTLTRDPSGDLIVTLQIEPTTMPRIKLLDRTDQVLLERQATAVLRKEYPNGPECPSECTIGEATVNVD